ncbi:hypothetical protein ALC53_01315 [Atta colombica]|uniref:Uncharacterized protein n=1 Tax=Atta colombica TaxID=520822 RepID=A0A195BUJ3_9HYME|nr:hypothetical protein ALC53_01315 [Atta colombica]
MRELISIVEALSLRILVGHMVIKISFEHKCMSLREHVIVRYHLERKLLYLVDIKLLFCHANFVYTESSQLLHELLQL